MIPFRAGKSLLLLVGITVLAFGLRLYALGRESLWMDELVTVETYRLSLGGIIAMAAELGQPPLDNLIGAAFWRLGLVSDAWMRVPAAVFGAGGVLLLGWWITQIASARAGLIAAVLLSVCPLHVVMSQEARPYTICFFLGLASILAFQRAWFRHRLGSWVLFCGVYFCFLLTRWTDPHFVAAGLLLFILVSKERGVPGHPETEMLRCAQHDGLEIKALRRARRVAALAGLGTAYLLYAPFFFIVLQRSRAAVGGQPGDSPFSRASAMIGDSFLAMIHGYSTRTLFAPLTGHWLVTALAATLFAVGFIVVVVRIFRAGILPPATKRQAVSLQGRPEHGFRLRHPFAIRLFATTMFAFPLLYAGVYAALGNAVPKPQYLLLGAAAVFGCIGIAIDAIASRLSRTVTSLLSFRAGGAFGRWAVTTKAAEVRFLNRQSTIDNRQSARFVGPVAAILVTGALAVPLAAECIERLAALDKQDWRGVMTHLRDHAAPGDVFAVLGSDTVPSGFRCTAFGRQWYGLGGVKFFNIGAHADLNVLESAPWQSVDNKLWVLVYTDRMYTGIDQIVPPSSGFDATSINLVNNAGDGTDGAGQVPARIFIHSFPGLFLMESPGAGPAPTVAVPQAQSNGSAQPAAERLMAAIDLLYAHTPPGRSLIWPGMLRTRYPADKGPVHSASAANCPVEQLDKVLAQCRNEHERQLVLRMHEDNAMR